MQTRRLPVLAVLAAALFAAAGEAQITYETGPFAEDFQRLFGLGDGETISVIDAQGVALAAIQGLKHTLDLRDQQMVQLTDRLAMLETGPTTDPRDRTAPAAASRGNAGGFGSIVHDGVRMDVQSATAVWNEEKRQLTIHLLPFDLSDDEIELLRRGREAEIQRELVDRQAWPHSNPRASYSISWYEPETVGDYRESTVFLYAYGVAGSNSNVNLTYLMSFDDETVSGSLTGTMNPGEEIHLRSSGEDSLSGSTVSWDLDVRTTILGSLPDAR